MKTFKQYIEARNPNHLGEPQYTSWSSWLRALKKEYGDNIDIEGDRDIASAFVNGKGIGEWDGVTGTVYTYGVGL